MSDDLPAIVRWGAAHIGEYSPDEFELSLCRAFIDGRADFIVLDSNPYGQRFLAACVAWAMHEGLLYCDRRMSDAQSEVSSFRLTDKGRARLTSRVS